MATEYRTDAMATLKEPQEHPGGFLLLEGRAARPGVYTYRRADGSTFRELVEESVLHDPDTLASLGRAPVTLEHPETGRVDADNWQAVAVGDLDGSVEVERMGGFVRVRLAVRRKDAIEDIRQRRRRELSCGYLVDVDTTPGVWEGQAYDQRQTRRIYNHLAIVQAGRHGPACSMRTDSAAAVDGPRIDTTPTALLGAEPKGAVMAKVRIDNAEYEVADAATAQVFSQAVRDRDEARQRADAAAAQAATLTSERDQLKGEKAALEAQLDGLKDAIPADQLQARIDARVELVSQAQRAGIEDSSRQTDAELRRAIVSKAFPALKLDGMAEGELAGAFRVAVMAVTHLPQADGGQSSTIASAFTHDAGSPTRRDGGRLSKVYLDSVQPASRQA